MKQFLKVNTRKLSLQADGLPSKCLLNCPLPGELEEGLHEALCLRVSPGSLSLVVHEEDPLLLQIGLLLVGDGQAAAAL